MSLIGIYTAVVLVGESLTYFGGAWLDRYLPDYAVAIAMVAVFAVLIIAWPIAIALDDRFFGKS